VILPIYYSNRPDTVARGRREHTGPRVPAGVAGPGIACSALLRVRPAAERLVWEGGASPRPRGAAWPLEIRKGRTTAA